eukprot:gnl/TRDRNA2_/TRDRNA2_147077_c0_seq1.p1 gnl/TRDRNA2_/TRDRNA2_147077_c0~~gnl/TRDRNA2_/TRDRNA2_147077_c0_seq1.p1  ORF type:complete len:426 (+),score=68.00 gnl/TRDRNA2_/TRDRNA2_147077_c0_seq1:22-1299(+)
MHAPPDTNASMASADTGPEALPGSGQLRGPPPPGTRSGPLREHEVPLGPALPVLPVPLQGPWLRQGGVPGPTPQQPMGMSPPWILSGAPRAASASVSPARRRASAAAASIGPESQQVLAPALLQELEATEHRVVELQRQRQAQVAELTRLAEALGASRRALAEAESDAEQLARSAVAQSTRRKEVESGLISSAERIQQLRDRCVKLQQTTPEPSDMFTFPKEVQPLILRATTLDNQLAERRERLKRRQQEKAAVEAARDAAARETESLRNQIETLENVYDITDRVLQELPRTEAGEVDPSAAVLALCKTLLPLVDFVDADEAMEHLPFMARQLRPPLVPSSMGANQMPTAAPPPPQAAFLPTPVRTRGAQASAQPPLPPNRPAQPPLVPQRPAPPGAPFRAAQSEGLMSSAASLAPTEYNALSRS